MKQKARFPLVLVALVLAAAAYQPASRSAPQPATPSPAMPDASAPATTTPTSSAPAPAQSRAAAARARAEAEDAEPLVIRVGVVNYNGSEQTHFDYQQLLAEMAEQHLERTPAAAAGKVEPRVSFRLADGSYDDVLEWYRTGLLDVAILSPGLVGELFLMPEWKPELPSLYVATESLKPAKQEATFADAERQRQVPHFGYRAVCLVRKDSPVVTFRDVWAMLADETRRDDVILHYVHPMSVSGYLLPNHVLRDTYKLDTTRLRTEWTYDHAQSLRLLADAPDDGRVRLAFVKDDAEIKDPPPERAAAYAASNFRRLEVGPLAEPGAVIPQDIVLVGPHFREHAETVARLFTGYRPAPPPGERVPDRIYERRDGWADEYRRVINWVDDPTLTAGDRTQQYLSLQQIAAKLRYLKENRPDTRVALVLSGGGAKCAYQLGAIEAIEEELGAHRGADGRRAVDIDLVVGTSGGAINALCVALGVTTTPEGRRKLAETWEGFNQSVFFRPWRPLSATLGLFIGLLQAFAVILSVRLFDPQKINWVRHAGKVSVGAVAAAAALWLAGHPAWSVIPVLVLALVLCARLVNNPTRDWWRHAGWAMLALAAVELLVYALDWTPWRRMGDAALIFLAAAAFVAVVIGVRIRDASDPRWLRRSVAVSLALFAAAAAAEVYFQNRTCAEGADCFRGYWRQLHLLRKDHLLHHLWLVLTLGAPWTVGALAALGAGLLVVGRTKFAGWRPMGYVILPPSKNLLVFRRMLLTRLSLALAALVALQISFSLFRNDSLSDSAGIQEAMAREIPELVRSRHAGFAPEGADDEARLLDISHKIVTDGLLQRDLVITGMRLPRGGPAGAGRPENDLYFYYDHAGPTAAALADAAAGGVRQRRAAAAHARSSAEAVRKDKRFKSLPGEYAKRLMDIVIGSSSIFPVFQPRPLPHARAAGGHAHDELIDGGFAHNTPVEAAVLWGATHILLVEASPEGAVQERSDYLLANSVAAFNYLFNQAQLADSYSRGKVEIYSLRPRPPGSPPGGAGVVAASDPCAAQSVVGNDGASVGANMCTFDFVRDFVDSARHLGLSDANRACFRKERAQPSF